VLTRGNHKALRFTDNHDETRAIVRLGEPASIAASAITLLLDGIPLIYNGQEIGDTAESGPPALFDRVPIYWGNAARRPDFFKVYQRLIHLRRVHSALHAGEVVWLDNTGADRVVTFLREGENQEFLVAVNCSNRRFEGNVEGGTQPLSLASYGILVRERRWGILFSR
jgi:glycosidase